MRSQLRESANLIAGMVAEGVVFLDKSTPGGIENIPKDILFDSLKSEKRRIYVLSKTNKLIAAHNYDEKEFSYILKQLPKELKKDNATIFGNIKNRPLVYVSKDEPEITVIVDTTDKISRNAIDSNSFKIILSLIVALLVILFVIAIYTYYLYINIRQLFKGITALSKGNYNRQIKLLTTAFTPFEIIFLAQEFNAMASQIRKSYLELKQLNEFRSNLIDTVSHELRTPLTSIQGYTSRLMRQDIIIDEATRQKSLRIIKEQSEVLKRLIDDLLIIPDIENKQQFFKLEPVNLSQVIEKAALLVRSDKIHMETANVTVLADKDRLVQVFVNLLENAKKYALSDIFVEAKEDGTIFVKNDCEVIPAKKLKKLFGKFIRLDNATTRTTRGTGLGLFIVKGSVEAMKGTISLSSTKKCGFCVKIKLKAES
jgi:signal transduction histidine kinase